MTLHMRATVQALKGWGGREEVQAGAGPERLVSGKEQDDMESAGVHEDFFYATAAISALTLD